METAAHDELTHPRDKAGKWVKANHPEPECPLADSIYDRENITEATLIAALEDVMSDQRILGHINWRAQYGDEVAQDVAEQALRAIRQKGTINYGYLFTITKHIALQHITQTSPTNRVAIGRYRAAISELRTELGRELTQNEEDEIAENIRMSEPAENRPTIGYHRDLGVRELSLDAATSALDIPSTRAPRPDTRGNLPAHDAFEEGKGHQAKADARRDAWNSLAQVSGAPPVRVRLNKNTATQHRSVFKTEADAEAAFEEAVNAAREGEDSVRTQAIFAPFGPCTPDERDGVLGMLERNRTYAYDLWSSCMDSTVHTKGLAA